MSQPPTTPATSLSPVVIRCRENGPFVISGALAGLFQIVDHLGTPFALPAGKDNIALCRCGQSKSRPFCDGTHKGCGFTAAELAQLPTPATP